MKTQNIFKLFIAAFFVAFLMSCEKEVKMDLPDSEVKIVIEGWIENGQPAGVIITKSAPYFDPIDSTTLANSLVTDAVVTVSDGSSTENLILSFNPNYFPYFIYQGFSIIGEVGKTYTLTVEVEGKTYTAETEILEPLYLDSVWFQVEPNKDSLGYVWANCYDPGTSEDYYRIFARRIGKDPVFVPVFGSVWEDKYFNGQEFVFSIYRGQASYLIDVSETESGEFTYFKTGDTIITKLTHISRDHYLFWRTIETEIFAGGNPFSAPTKIVSNIEGGALGIWGGYAATYDTVIANY